MDATLRKMGPNISDRESNIFPETDNKLTPIKDNTSRPSKKKIKIFFSLNHDESDDSAEVIASVDVFVASVEEDSVSLSRKEGVVLDMGLAVDMMGLEMVNRVCVFLLRKGSIDIFKGGKSYNK